MKKEQGTFFEKSGLLTLAAFRYCLGRRSYIVSQCCDYLITYWDSFLKQTQDVIVAEIEDAFERSIYGMSWNRQDWQRVLDRATMRYEEGGK